MVLGSRARRPPPRYRSLTLLSKREAPLPPLGAMRARLSESRLAERLGADLTPLQVLTCAALLYLADWAFQRSGSSFFPGGPLDETAHFLTALLLIQAIPAKHRLKIVVPALIASVATAQQSGVLPAIGSAL